MKEGDQITNEELVSGWNETLKFYSDLIEKGFKLRPLRFLVRHVIDQGYSEHLFAGTSLYNLLISVPNDGGIDYTRTLRVAFDHLTQTVKFDYWNTPRSERTENSVEWSCECQATEVVDTFEHFLQSTRILNNLKNESTTTGDTL